MESPLKLAVGAPVALQYGPHFGSEELQLLEVTEKILEELLVGKVHIKGDADDEAVLCTSAKTFIIKFVGTTNTVFLVPPASGDIWQNPATPEHQEPSQSNVQEGASSGSGTREAVASVTATASGHLELVETAPRLEKLRFLLNQQRYTGEEEATAAEGQEMEESTSGRPHLYTLSDLESHVQASHIEILEGLTQLGAVELEGYWRLLDEKYQGTLLDVMLLTAAEHGWPLGALPGGELVAAMQAVGFPPVLVSHCLRACGKKVSDEMDVDQGQRGRGTWALDEGAVCLHRAKQLLSAAAKWHLDEFMKAWTANVPSGMTPRIDMLRGEALVDTSGGRPWLRLFRACDLPESPGERFAALFAERPKWQLSELEPYLRDLRTPGKTMEALLLKYTRISQATPDSPAVYSAR